MEGHCGEQQIESLQLGRLESRKAQSRQSTELGQEGSARFFLQWVWGSGRAAAPSPESAELKHHRGAGVQQMKPFEL